MGFGRFTGSLSLSASLATCLIAAACSSSQPGGSTSAQGGNDANPSGGNPSANGGGGSSSNGGSASAAGGSTNPSGGASTQLGGQAGTTLGGNASTSSGGTHQGGAANSAGAQAMGGSATTTADCGAASTGLVTFSVPSGTFQGSINVALATSTSGAEIRYTTDHTPPTASSPVYAGTPIAVSATTELIARVFVQGVGVGEPQAAVYVARDFDQPHDLPVIVLDSYGKAIPAPPPLFGGPPMGMGGSTGAGGAPAAEDAHAAFLSFEPANGTTSLAATPKVATAAAFHVRGQSSASYDKKPYRVELQKVDGSDRDCALLGMPKESDWVLHAPFPDKALIRNAFVYSLGRDIGIPAPRGMFAEVYVNSANRPLSSSDYLGVYLLVENIKNQKDRLNLHQLKPTDTTLPAISGGYIFQFQWQVMDIEQQLKCPSEQANCWNWIEVNDPKPWVQQQNDFLTQYVNSFVTALHSANPSDESTGYPAFIDVTSFANQIIIHELTRNFDAYVRSQYFAKDRDGKIFAGPLWDYDLIAGVGSTSTYSNMSQMGWQYESNAARINTTADWFPRLLADAAFKTKLVARWKELRQTELSDAQLGARIVRLTAGLENAAQRNFRKWNNLASQRVAFFDTPTADSWQGQVTAMRDWLIGRAAWLDKQWQ